MVKGGLVTVFTTGKREQDIKYKVCPSTTTGNREVTYRNVLPGQALFRTGTPHFLYKNTYCPKGPLEHP